MSIPRDLQCSSCQRDASQSHYVSPQGAALCGRCAAKLQGTRRTRLATHKRRKLAGA